MLIATDPLSLVFIACFLFGLLFLLATSLLGGLGHGHTAIHSATHHVGGLSGGGHAPAPATPHVVSHAGAAHAAASGHAHTHMAVRGAGLQQSSSQGNWLSQLAFINPTTVVLFLLGFGLLGYIFHNTARLALPLTLVFSALAGMVVALLLLLLLSRIFGDTDVSTDLDVADRTGLLGKVSITIPEHGLGEIMYISPGGMRKSVPARGIDGRRIEREQEVVVVSYQRGIAEVETWERFMHEEGGLDPHPPASHEDELAKLRTLLEEADFRDSKLAMQNDLQKE